MFDVHCHILPMVDDGSSSIEESLAMIKLAYEDGIRGIVATPHKNHPIDFKPKFTVEESYEMLRNKVNKLYPDFNLVLGSELYVTEACFSILKNIAKTHTINNTNYILIEFERDVTFQFIEEVVHELKVMGLLPIIAHVEMYDIFLNNSENVYILRNQGAYIQLTAASITGKRGKKREDFCQKLLKLGAVDTIVTDAHSLNRRRPLLKESYEFVVELIGQDCAEKIYSKNPGDIIAGKIIELNELKYKESSKKHKKTKTAILAAVMAASLIIIGIGAGRNYKTISEDVIATNSKPVQQVESIAEDKLETVPDSTENQENESSESSETKVSKKGSSKVKSDIESKYYGQLKSLEGTYVGELEGIVANMKYAQENIKDEAVLSSTLEDYKQQIFDLEAQCDNQVYSILYDMQNELEAEELDVSNVQVYRDEYNSTKMDKQTEYINRLGY